MEYTNKLINEKSPYLLQHAHNPVNWYPWSSEAFEEAKNKDLPIFLSIGYSSCHWCHVMERESFEDTQVAELLNKNFISLKVDREEMPDIDHMFMDVCTTLTGKGGWPLSCFITYDKKPFFAGTYFPKIDSYGMTGFTTILKNISINWKQDREDLIQASDEILEHISQATNFGENTSLNKDVSKTAFEQLSKSFDKKYGGFGSSPKFPTTHNLLFLIRYYLLYKDKTAIDMVDKTLDSMYKGGIFDHIGGGFCRYSTDKQWLVPHFEKMMYDNAMLIIAYCEAGIVIDNKYFEIAKRIINYCVNEMRDENGGFYTAQDADSEGVEGKFYVFTPSEIKEALGDIEGERFCTLFDITKNGNFEGKSIPNLINKTQTGEDSIFADFCFPKLYEYRQKRVPPFKDDKLLTQINGLMVASLSIAGRLLNDDKYLSYAEETALFIIENLSLNDRLYTGFRGELLKHPATSDDYAYVLWGMFELYQATLKPKWLQQCIHIAERMLELFVDENGQGLYLSGNDVEHLPIRGKNTFDGALPSGNSISANIILKLSQLTGNEKFANASNMIISGIANDINGYPTAFTGLLCADLHNHSNQINVNIVNGEQVESMLSYVNNFNPFMTVLETGIGYEEMNEIISEPQKNIDNKATAFICSKNGCMPPITDFIELKEKLKSL